MPKALKNCDGGGPLPSSVLNKYVELNECVRIACFLLSGSQPSRAVRPLDGPAAPHRPGCGTALAPKSSLRARRPQLPAPPPCVSAAGRGLPFDQWETGSGPWGPAAGGSEAELPGVANERAPGRGAGPARGKAAACQGCRDAASTLSSGVSASPVLIGQARTDGRSRAGGSLRRGRGR